MSINGVISSEPLNAEDRIKFTVHCDQTNRSIFCVTELDFGQFPAIKEGDHVTLTGATVKDAISGNDCYFCADSIHPFGKGSRMAMSRP
jgi:hypothetical protein